VRVRVRVRVRARARVRVRVRVRVIGRHQDFPALAPGRRAGGGGGAGLDDGGVARAEIGGEAVLRRPVLSKG